MTWTKLSDDFADQCRDLSDAAFRTHVEGLLWTMRRETGGWLDERDIRRFAETFEPDDAVKELVAHGWWSEEDHGYRIVHHMEHQPEPEVLAARRDLAALRQQRWRAKKTGQLRDMSTRDETRYSGRDGSGRDGE